MMMGDDGRAESMVKYFIDQSQGKAKEKAANALEDDEGIAEDMERMDKMLSKLESLENESNDEVQGSESDTDAGNERGDGHNRDGEPTDG